MSAQENSTGAICHKHVACCHQGTGENRRQGGWWRTGITGFYTVPSSTTSGTVAIPTDPDLLSFLLFILSCSVCPLCRLMIAFVECISLWYRELCAQCTKDYKVTDNQPKKHNRQLVNDTVAITNEACGCWCVRVLQGCSCGRNGRLVVKYIASAPWCVLAGWLTVVLVLSCAGGCDPPISSKQNEKLTLAYRGKHRYGSFRIYLRWKYVFDLCGKKTFEIRTSGLYGPVTIVGSSIYVNKVTKSILQEWII